jgi:hypothetical protein
MKLYLMKPPNENRKIKNQTKQPFHVSRQFIFSDVFQIKQKLIKQSHTIFKVIVLFMTNIN